jgi:RNA polymerase sigma-70 factor, ECF subfamily
MIRENNIKPNCDVPKLWLEHKTELQRFIFKRVKDSDLTNDILQEVLLKVYNFCLSKSGVGNVRSWLFQITKNTIVDFHREQSKISYDLPDLSNEDSHSAFEEASEFVLPMINFLPKEYAEPLKMADLEGIKQAEVAKRLGMSLTATKSRIQRARLLLKKEFAICCDFETDQFGNFISFGIKDSCLPLQQSIRQKNIVPD